MRSNLPLVVLLVAFKGWSQPIEVAQSTLKIPALSQEVFYYGFAAGDQLIFSFQEVNKKELKEVEITELPGASRFMEFKTSSIPTKTITVPQTAIYQFRFTNSAITGRICRFSIQRIPASPDTHKFNTHVYWRTVYDTIKSPQLEQYLERSDTTFYNVLDQVAKVSSQNALNGNANKTIVEFNLPEGTMAWSYYIGVGTEGKAAYDAARDEFVNTAAAGLSEIPGYGSLAALALHGINTFAKVQGPDNVKYWFIPDWENAQRFMANMSFQQFNQGDVVNTAAQMKAPLSGKVYLALYNDNLVDAIEVIVKVSTVSIQQKWNTRTITTTSVQSRQEPYLMN